MAQGGGWGGVGAHELYEESVWHEVACQKWHKEWGEGHEVACQKWYMTWGEGHATLR